MSTFYSNGNDTQTENSSLKMKRLNHFDNEHVKNFDESLDKPVVNQGVLLNFNVSEVILYKLLNQQLFNTKVSLSAHFPFRSSVP